MAAAAALWPTASVVNGLEPTTRPPMSGRRSGQTLVVGIGGAGGTIVDTLQPLVPPRVRCLAIDTDQWALERRNGPRTLAIADRGAEGHPAVGRQAAESHRTNIQETLKRYGSVIVAAGLGGGTGSGASPVIVQLARDLDIVVRVYVSFPFAFEGKPRWQQAVDALELLPLSDEHVTVISNEDVVEEVRPKLPVSLRVLFRHSDQAFVRCIMHKKDMRLDMKSATTNGRSAP